MNQPPGKLLIIAGTIAIIAGILIIYSDKIPLLRYLGKLPGDISIRRENFSFYFPLATCLLLSILATIIIRLIGKLK